MKSLDFVEKELQRRDLPPFRVGDAVRVHAKVKEGDKERIQVFEGLVIRRRGSGAGATFTVRKIASGVGVERIFPLESPLVTKVEIRSRGYVRRSRLYYLRDLSGKKARLHSKVRDLSELVSPVEIESRRAEQEAAVAAPEPAPEEAVAQEAKVAQQGEPKGKARKRAKARVKAERKAQQESEAARKKAEAPPAAEAEAGPES